MQRSPIESEPPYLYVHGNPVNRIDPSGLQSPNDPPSYCQSPQWPEDTRWRDDPVCQQWRGGSTPTPTPFPTSPSVPVPSSPPQYADNQRADGFATGISGALNLFVQVVTFRGKETVWNFATREKMDFTVTGKFSTREIFGQPVGTTGFCTSLVGINVDPYFAYIWGFKPETSGGNFIDDYRGTFVVGQISEGVPLIETGIPASVGGGVAVFSSVIGDSWFPNFKVWGYSVSLPEASVGIGIQELAGFGVSGLALNYTPVGLPKPFNSVGDMAQDLRTSGPPLVGLQAANVLLSHYPQ